MSLLDKLGMGLLEFSEFMFMRTQVPSPWETSLIYIVVNVE